jgi:hypothetical protein
MSAAIRLEETTYHVHELCSGRILRHTMYVLKSSTLRKHIQQGDKDRFRSSTLKNPGEILCARDFGISSASKASNRLRFY